MPDTFLRLPDSRHKERSSFTATVYFRSSADAAEAPTTAHYRIDDLTTRTVILDWTALSAAASISIAVKSAENKIVNDRNNWERRQITVAADKDTVTETRDIAQWLVENIGGFEDDD